jgi:hypothetical protein
MLCQFPSFINRPHSNCWRLQFIKLFILFFLYLVPTSSLSLSDTNNFVRTLLIDTPIYVPELDSGIKFQAHTKLVVKS